MLSLTAFGYLNWKNTEGIDLIYNVDSRFMATITKEKLHRAKSVLDIVPKKAEWSKISFQNMTIAVLRDENEIREQGDDEVLNAAQIKLLQSADYSTDFYVKGKGRKKGTGPLGLKELEKEESDFVYYLTVIPEKEAEYTTGYDALITYLKENSKAATAIIQQDKLKPGKVHFIVTKEGKIEHVSLESTSGYPTVDEKLVELVKNMPGKWQPAENSTGEQVDQEFVFFFGLEGC